LLLLAACAAGCANMREWARRDDPIEMEQASSEPRRGSRLAPSEDYVGSIEDRAPDDDSATRLDQSPAMTAARRDAAIVDASADETFADEAFNPELSGEEYRPATRRPGQFPNRGNASLATSSVRQAAAESPSARRFAERADWLTPADSPAAGTNHDETGGLPAATDDRAYHWSFRHESNQARPETVARSLDADDGPPAAIGVQTPDDVQDGTLRIVRFDPESIDDRAPESIARCNLMLHGNPLRSSDDGPLIEPLSPADAQALRDRFAPVREQFRKEPARRETSSSQPPANGQFSSITWKAWPANPAPSSPAAPIDAEARIVRAGYDDEWTANAPDANEDAAPRRFVDEGSTAVDQEARSPKPPIRIIGPDFRELGRRPSEQPSQKRWR
jgi:hypothetical protein